MLKAEMAPCFVMAMLLIPTPTVADVTSELARLTGRLLQRGYFIRGALVKGPLYHDDKMIFGEALVRAYQLESEVVRYPRVMVTRDVWLDSIMLKVKAMEDH